MEDGKVQVARSLQHQRGSGPVFVWPKTCRSRRPIKLGQRALEALKPHLKAQLLQRMKIWPFWQDQDLVFPTEHGAPHDPS